MKVKALIFFVFLFVSQVLFAFSRNATVEEVNLELSAEKTEYAQYEFVRLHLKATYIGVVDSGEMDDRLERVIQLFRHLRVRGPVPYPFKSPEGVGIGEGQLPEDMPVDARSALPGDSLEGSFYVLPLRLLSAPGEYEMWIEGKECCWKNRLYESNHIRITVVEPQGKDKEAFDYAKTPQRLLGLMGGPVGSIQPVTKEEVKAWPRGRAFTIKDYGIPFWQGFVTKAEGSAYHPFALFALSRQYFYGNAETRKKKTKDPNVYSREPDYELLLQSSDDFLKLYPDHPLADEVHYFRLVALYGLGKKDEAIKEYDLIHERLAPLEKALWEQFRKNGRRDWSDEQASAEMEKGPLYVWGAAKKIKDLFENNMINGQKRRIPSKLSEKEWPVQANELPGASKSRWAPR